MDSLPSEVSLLHRISSIVASNRSVDEMLGEIIGMTVQVTGCDACLVYLIEPSTGEVVLRASQVPHATEIGNLTVAAGQGLTGWVIQHKSVVALPEKAYQDKRFIRLPGLVEDTYEAFCSVPLVSSGEVIGVINVHHKDRHDYTPEEIALLTFVGEQMGGALARARLQEENTRLAAEAEEMRKQLETRKLVERAKGILQYKFHLTEEEAYLRLRNESRRLRRPMRDLAEAIILTEELSRKAAEPGAHSAEAEGD
jgi:uroporphyrinogen-III synthase